MEGKTIKKILVTGGLGYIGSHTVIELVEAGYEVEIIDNLYNSNIKCHTRLEEICKTKMKLNNFDMLEYNKLEEVFKSTTFYGIIHFAGYKSVGEAMKEPLKYYKNNLISSIYLMELAIKYNCSNLIFSSSACVYGSSNDPFLENSKLGPINPYGRTKLMIEEIIIDACNSSNGAFKSVILRYFNPVGAHKSGLIGDSPNGIPANLFSVIENHVKGKLPHLNVFGKDYNTIDGTGIRDYIHVVDLAKAHVCALAKFEDKELKTYDIYNIGTNNGLTVLQIINAYMKNSGKEIIYNFIGRREGDSEKSVANAEKALKELNWKANLDVNEMCADSYRWISQNPNGYD